MESSGIPPDCNKCGFVEILPENYEIVEFLTNYTSCLVDGYGGINIVAIKEMLNITGIEVDESNVTKIITYLSAFLSKKLEVTKNG